MLSEKLYELRKNSGLSQEQLAEKLNVSRQAVSKWELGTALPETEKLIIISNYFDVSLDYLLKDIEKDNPMMVTKENKDIGNRRSTVGLLLSVAGIIAMIIWGVILIFSPETNNQISESSMLTIDGNGIFLIMSITAIIVGAILLLKRNKNQEE